MTTAFPTMSLVLTVLLLAPTAAAEKRTHDGFFLRGSLGYSYLSDGYRVEGGSPLANADGNLTGHGPTFEAMAGGTVKQGDLRIVHGGGILFGVLPFVKLTENGANKNASLTNTIDLYYVNETYPDPARGLSVQTMLGLAFLRTGVPSGIVAPSGLLFGLGFSDSVWVGDEWSLGLQARVMFQTMGDKDDMAKRTHLAWMPTLSLVATYH